MELDESQKDGGDVALPTWFTPTAMLLRRNSGPFVPRSVLIDATLNVPPALVTDRKLGERLCAR